MTTTKCDDRKKLNLKSLNNNDAPQLSKKQLGWKKVKRNKSASYRKIKLLEEKKRV